MRNNYDFSQAKRNPYARKLKKQITIRLDAPTIDLAVVDHLRRVADLDGAAAAALVEPDRTRC